METARENLERDDVVVVGDDERRRYLAQVTVNLAQLDARAGNLLEAADSLARHVDWTRSQHAGSVSEAIAVSAYVNYRAGKLDLASSLAEEAERLIVGEGAPSRLAVARKVLAASLYEAGEIEESTVVLQRLADDPAGLAGWQRLGVTNAA